MHTTPRKMCPRHQEICCKNPFPEMLSFLGFGTRRLFKFGCFIDISGAKTTRKHCSFWQLTLRRDQATNIIISTTFLHSEKTRQYKAPRNTDIQATSFGTHPFYQNSQRKIPRSNSIWTTSEYSSLELTLFKHMSPQTQAQSSPRQYHRKSTVNTSFLPPHWRRLVNNDTGLSPSLGQTHQLTLYMLCKQRN